MTIPFAALGEGAVVGIVALGVKHSAGGALLRCAFPAQVDQVILEWRAVLLVTHNASLDGDAAGPIGQPAHGRDARRPAATEGAASSAPSRSTMQSAGLLSSSQYLRDEGLGTTGAPSVADTTKPDVEIIVAGHDADAHNVHEVSIFQVLVRIGTLSCLVAHCAKCLIFLRSCAPRPRRTLRLLSCHRAVGWPPLPVSPSYARKCSP